jgi:hypothetical protein
MGKVYILTNDSMPGIIKIGVTDQEGIEDRIKQLDNTSIPTPFRFYFAIESDRYIDIEDNIHDAFSDFRIRKNREFFKMEPERAVSALRISGASEIKMTNEMIDEEGIKIEETPELKNRRRRKGKISFELLNIPIGTELVFTRDLNKKCKIISDNEVEFDGSNFTLSSLALKLLNELGYNWPTANGTLYFKYKDKTINEIWTETNNIENEEENNDN